MFGLGMNTSVENMQWNINCFPQEQKKIRYTDS